MIKLLKIVASLRSVYSVSTALSKKELLENIKEVVINSRGLSDVVKYTAHTGCVYSPDNSLESISVGVKYGAQTVEFDIRYHSGDMLLSHDEPVGGEVTLEEAFLKVKDYGKLTANVDVKSTEELHLVQEIAIKTDMLDRVFFTGIREEDVDIVRAECPLIPYYLNVDVLPEGKQTPGYLQELADKVKECGAVGININKDSVSKELVGAFHNAGLKASVWTVDKESEIYKVLSCGPDNITTRRPDKMQRIMGGVEKLEA